MNKLATILLLSILISGCTLPDGYQPGETSEEVGQLIVDQADALNDTLNQSPGLDQAFGDQIRPGIGLYRLAGEALLLFGLALQTKRRKEAENAILEIDEKDNTPKAKEQAVSIQAKKTIRNITG